ncbi:hypothetical protein HDE_02767 [Halotydeus destructor]|nr:hypothetical protein HDE_02767 [Halotydeus destructor]
MQLPQLINAVKSSAIKSFNSSLERFSRSSAGSSYRQLYDRYEDFLGIKEVKLSQRSVLTSESEFAEASKQRREMQEKLIDLQDDLKTVRVKLESTHRGDENYLNLITKEHNMIKSELTVLKDLRRKEETERECFSSFSRKLRDAHEYERLRQEKSKYLSLVGSVVGAFLGVVGASINHSVKMKDFKKVLEVIEGQNALYLARENFADENMSNADTMSAETTAQVDEVPITFNQPFDDAKLAQLLLVTQNNIDHRMRQNLLVTVAATYALLVITIPLILKFTGN